ncbi:MAG: hypothetical protein ABIQ53_09430 [Terracoccus sp.]
MSFPPGARTRPGARAALSTFRVGVAVVLAVGGVSACTLMAGGPAPTSTRPVPRSAAAAVPPTPSLTALDTVRCAVTRGRPPNRDLLPARLIWPSGDTDERGQTLETAAGADASQCPGELPKSGCNPPTPWSAPLVDDFFVASGATLLTTGSSGMYFANTDGSGVFVPNRQSVRYGVVKLRAGDPRGAVAYLERALRQCASGAPQTLGGSARLVGTTPSDYRQGPATIVLLTGPDAAAWLVVDGTMQITETELARIVKVAESRLLSSRR